MTMTERPNRKKPAPVSPHPRMTAYKVLMRVEGEGGYSQIALNAALSGAKLEPRDKAFVTRLVYGVLENVGFLDHVISSYTKGSARLEPEVRCLLRMAVYQMVFLDTPDAAAVNESVKLAKQLKLFRATGFCATLSATANRSACPTGKKPRCSIYACGIPAPCGWRNCGARHTAMTFVRRFSRLSRNARPSLRG